MRPRARSPSGLFSPYHHGRGRIMGQTLCDDVYQRRSHVSAEWHQSWPDHVAQLSHVPTTSVAVGMHDVITENGYL